MITRQQRLSGQATHREYFAQFVTDAIKQVLLQRIGKSRIVECLDPDFASIPINQWRALPAYRSTAEAIKATGTFMSEVDKVCVYKEAASQIREQHATSRRHSIRVRFQGMPDTLTTDINGTVESICAYYMQNDGMLNIGTGGEDRMAKVVGIDVLD